MHRRNSQPSETAKHMDERRQSLRAREGKENVSPHVQQKNSKNHRQNSSHVRDRELDRNYEARPPSERSMNYVSMQRDSRENERNSAVPPGDRNRNYASRRRDSSNKNLRNESQYLSDNDKQDGQRNHDAYRKDVPGDHRSKRENLRNRPKGDRHYGGERNHYRSRSNLSDDEDDRHGDFPAERELDPELQERLFPPSMRSDSKKYDYASRDRRQYETSPTRSYGSRLRNHPRSQAENGHDYSESPYRETVIRRDYIAQRDPMERSRYDNTRDYRNQNEYLDRRRHMYDSPYRGRSSDESRWRGHEETTSAPLARGDLSRDFSQYSKMAACPTCGVRESHSHAGLSWPPAREIHNQSYNTYRPPDGENYSNANYRQPNNYRVPDRGNYSNIDFNQPNNNNRFQGRENYSDGHYDRLNHHGNGPPAYHNVPRAGYPSHPSQPAMVGHSHPAQPQPPVQSGIPASQPAMAGYSQPSHLSQPAIVTHSHPAQPQLPVQPAIPTAQPANVVPQPAISGYSQQSYNPQYSQPANTVVVSATQPIQPATSVQPTIFTQPAQNVQPVYVQPPSIVGMSNQPSGVYQQPATVGVIQQPGVAQPAALGVVQAGGVHPGTPGVSFVQPGVAGVSLVQPVAVQAQPVYVTSTPSQPTR